jgi:hypothetical protein
LFFRVCWQSHTVALIKAKKIKYQWKKYAIPNSDSQPRTIFPIMHIRFLSKLSLFVTILALPQLVTSNSHSTSISNSFLCSSVLAADFKEIGETGIDGATGIKGQDGRNSDSLTVFADGSPMTLDLSGENGFAGKNGESGKNAICEPAPEKISKNIRHPNGGNGGDAGDGGNGGNGGELTVYTTDKTNLQQIYVIATGGEGGEAGAPGNGGEGCQCDKPFLNEEHCEDGTCTTREFECIDGYPGRKGRSGRQGRVGQLGTLTLINLDKSLAPDQPEATIPIGELKNRGFTLSKNDWATKTGAAALFAPGSIITDRYQELVARYEHTVLLVWDASQPVEEYADEPIEMKLVGKDKASISFPEDLWLETNIMEREGITEFFVFNAIKEKDVAKLKSEGLLGNGSNLQLKLVDRADKSDIVKTDFSLKYRIDKFADDLDIRPSNDYRTQYEGAVPPEAVIQEGSTFTINLGKLPIAPELLQPGTKIEVQLTANRSFGEKSKQQKILVREKIR